MGPKNTVVLLHRCICILLLLTICPGVLSSDCHSHEFYNNKTSSCHPCHCANSGVCENYIGCTDNICNSGWLHPPACQSTSDPLSCPANFIYHIPPGEEVGECAPCRCMVKSKCGTYGCSDNRCYKGWTNPPICNIECDENHFGINCAHECHCKANDTCSNVNGLCSPQGGCHEDWIGSGCQTRIPVLVNPPVITHIGCQTLTVTFTQWQEGKDIGDPEVGQYILQWRTNATSNSESEDGSVWISEIIPKDDNTEIYERTLGSLSEDSAYTFRVISNRTQYGYITVGGVSPETQPVIPACERSTESTLSTTTEENLSTTESTVELENTPSSTDTTDIVTVEQTGDVQITMLSNGDVTVEWLEPVDIGAEITGYTITYQIVGIGNCDTTYTESPVTIEVNRSQLSHTLTDLIGWRKYAVTIAARDDAGRDSEIGKAEFTSQEQKPSNAPANLGHGAVGSTSVELTWTAVPCADRGGALMYYTIQAINVDHSMLPIVATLSVDTERALISNLIPYTTYGFRVKMVNQAEQGPYSGYYYMRTNEGVPPPPGSVAVDTVTSDSVRVTWSSPNPPHGLIQGYRVKYRVNYNGYTASTTEQEGSELTGVTLTELLPDTDYEIQVQASTRAGWGDYSDPVIQRTSEGVPSAPRELIWEHRNTTCLFLYWSRPALLSGKLVMYQVAYKPVTILSGSAVDPAEQFVETPTRGLKLCQLKPAVEYKISIRAKTNSDIWGDAITSNMWTSGGQPEPPPQPIFLSVRLTFISIELTPAVQSTGPVSGYFVVAKAHTGNSQEIMRKRRSIPDPVDRIPLPGFYTTAFMEPQQLRAGYIFVVGDGYTYGDYKNKELEPFTNYSISVVVASTVDGVTKFAFSQLEQVVSTEEAVTPRHGRTTSSTTIKPRTTTEETDKTTTETVDATMSSTSSSKRKSSVTSSTHEGGSQTSVIVAVVFVVFALLIFVLVIIWCRVKKRKRKPRYQSSEKDWLSYYTTNYQKKSKPEPWTDSFSMNESKTVVSVDEVKYATVDIQVSEIHHNRPEVPYEEEYRQLPYGQHYMWEVAMKRENKDRNRFDHILAYDQSRVILKGKEGGTYINANYIHGYADKKNAYIAAQSPFNEKTIYDFWYMIYQENVSQIVFLDRPDEKSSEKPASRYWPNAGTVMYNNLAVKHIETELYANFLIRRLDIYIEGKTVKHVTQYQYIVWPEHGLPDDPIPLLMFRLKVRMDKDAGGTSPLVANCETGVSRSAIYIALDSLLEEAKMEHSINVFRFCNQMRHSRVNMIRTVKQYEFLYEALFEALITNYNLIGDSLKMNYKQLSQVNPVNNKSYFMEQFEVLEKYAHSLSPEDCKTALMECNQRKNRNQAIVPADKHRPVLRSLGPGQTDYINAVFLDSYLTKNAFIVTQNPKEDTVVDFWKMVYQCNVSIIVMLSQKDHKLETCAHYWPQDKGEESWGPYCVKLVEEFEEEHCTVRTLKFWDTTKAEQEQRELQHFQFKSWKVTDKKPWSREGFIQLLEAVEDIQDETDAFTEPIVVHCADGASKSGLYCACAMVCEVIREEDEVDVFHTIKHLKNRRKQFVSSYEQYKFVFKLLWQYMSTRLEKKTIAHPDENQSKPVTMPQKDMKETYTLSEPKTHEVCIG